MGEPDTSLFSLIKIKHLVVCLYKKKKCFGDLSCTRLTEILSAAEPHLEEHLSLQPVEKVACSKKPLRARIVVGRAQKPWVLPRVGLEHLSEHYRGGGFPSGNGAGPWEGRLGELGANLGSHGGVANPRQRRSLGGVGPAGTW